jgi:SCY1-like protein 1
LLFKDDGSNCSIFSFDINANKSRLPLARNALKKLRTLRHPGVIKVLDTAEVGYSRHAMHIGDLTRIYADRNVYIYCYREGRTTEVAYQAQEFERGDAEVGTIWCRGKFWVQENSDKGLIIYYQQTIKFINDEASSVHGALRVSSIYTSESGEWKVGGFEVLSSMKDDDAIIYVRLD